MGRRKIEIQPITHERNRSVTFLKRKNGLFKKAYELGVLCSVDVAVIIFGNQQKLYQYSSSDIYDIVQRHIRHEGEKDTRTAGDFSGASGKMEDNGDGYEDDVDEEDEPTPSRTNQGVKRRGDGKEKPENLRPMAIPQPPMPAYPTSSGQTTNGASSSLPVSGERLSSTQRAGTPLAGSPSLKKARTNSSVGISRSSSDEAGYAYHTTSSPASHPSHLPANARHAAQSVNLGYNGLYPSNPGYVSNGFDFSQPTSSRGSAQRSSYPSAVSAAYGQQHHADTGNFNPQRQPSNRQHQTVAGPSTADLLAVFVDSGGPRLSSQGQSHQSFGALDWPVHSANQQLQQHQQRQRQGQSQSSGPSQRVHSQSGSSRHTNAQPENWLGLFSSNSVPPSANSNSTPASAADMFGVGNSASEASTNGAPGVGTGGRRSASAASHAKHSRIGSAAGSGTNSSMEDEGGSGEAIRNLVVSASGNAVFVKGETGG